MRKRWEQINDHKISFSWFELDKWTRITFTHMHVFLFNFLVSYNLIGRSEAVSLESKMKIKVHYRSPYRNMMLKHSPDSDYVSTASVHYSVVASIFVANITMEPKASRMMSLGILSLFTQCRAGSTAKCCDGRWTWPRWLRTVFLCVWKTARMPRVKGHWKTAVMRKLKMASIMLAGHSALVFFSLIAPPIVVPSSYDLMRQHYSALCITEVIVYKWPHIAMGGGRWLRGRLYMTASPLLMGSRQSRMKSYIHPIWLQRFFPPPCLVIAKKINKSADGVHYLKVSLWQKRRERVREKLMLICVIIIIVFVTSRLPVLLVTSRGQLMD